MAAYTFLGAEPTLTVYSDDLVQPTQRITAQALASGVVYSVPFHPYPTDPQGNVIWTPEAISSQLALWAGTWDDLAAWSAVLGVSVTQDVDAAGRLRDVAVVTVSSQSGKSSTVVTVPVAHFLDATGREELYGYVHQLDLAEGP